jgi:mannitol-specific phosphotransferase system IIBC component
MKEILKKIFGIDNVATEVAGIVDRFVRTKDEKAEFEKELTKIFIQAEKDMQENVTERWKADMGSSGSWLSKNVRPLVLLFLVVSTITMVFIDAGLIVFEVKESWVDLLQIVLITVISAYFGGRSFEKIKIK